MELINIILESYNNINEHIDNIDNLSSPENSSPSSPVLKSVNNIKSN